MNEPWGISGPAFAWLYGVCAVLPVALAVVNEWWLRRDTGARTVPGLYHLAALADGAERVPDTAVAGLMERHALRPDGRGVLRPVRPVPADPFERAVVALIPGNGIGLRELRSKMARHELRGGDREAGERRPAEAAGRRPHRPDFRCGLRLRPGRVGPAAPRPDCSRVRRAPAAEAVVAADGPTAVTGRRTGCSNHGTTTGRKSVRLR